VRDVRARRVATGAAAIAFYSTLALFPAAIFALSVLPYLPVPHIEAAILDLLRQLMPGHAAEMFTSTVHAIVTQRSAGLVSFGFLVTAWAASNGVYAVMRELNETCGAREHRPFWKVRLVALGLTVAAFVLLTVTLTLVVFGTAIQDFLLRHIGFRRPLLLACASARWVAIVTASTLAYSLVYHFGPDARRPFRLVTPGAASAALGTLGSSLLFRVYVANFAHYDRMYGSIGAFIVLMTWLYLIGWMLLVGFAIDTLLDTRTPRATRQEASA
jgi:membrane protein